MRVRECVRQCVSVRVPQTDDAVVAHGTEERFLEMAVLDLPHSLEKKIKYLKIQKNVR